MFDEEIEEKTAEQRFAAIYPSIYPALKAQEKFTEEDWKVGLDNEAGLQEETLTELQKEFFTALRTKAVDTMKVLIAREIIRDNFCLSDLLSTIDYWQMTNLLHPDQPHFSIQIRDLIWNLIGSPVSNRNLSELLHWAIITYQSEDIINPLIADIPDVNTTNERGMTFLHLACFFNQKTTVESLLAKDADPLKEDIDGNLPLHIACSNNHLGLVMRLSKVMAVQGYIPNILENGTTYSPEITETLELYAKLTALSTEKKETSTMLASLVEQNGLHAKKKSKKKPEQKRENGLIQEINLRWNADVEAAFKRQKLGK